MQPSITDLPSELLVHIFSIYIKSEGHKRFLKNIPLVCRKWKNLHSTPSLWKDIGNMCPRKETWTSDQFKKLGEKGLLSSAQSLNICQVRFRCERERTKIVRYCHNLKQLTISYISNYDLDILAEQCKGIEKLKLGLSFSYREDMLGPYLRVRGQNLKCLYVSTADESLVLTIANNCPSLEELVMDKMMNIFAQHNPFLIDEFVVGCPRLRELTIRGYDMIQSDIRNHNGFENMVNFRATAVDFSGLGLHSYLKHWKDLRELTFSYCRNVPWSEILTIPSDKVEVFETTVRNQYDCPMSFLKEAAAKWRHSLKVLKIVRIPHDLTEVLEAYYHENSNPKLEELILENSGPVEVGILKKLVRACENLENVYVDSNRVFLQGLRNSQRLCSYKKLKVDGSRSEISFYKGKKKEFCVCACV